MGKKGKKRRTKQKVIVSIPELPAETVIVDGSLLEGGGQILRNAITFSALMKIPIKIINIRANRSSPGLRAQHKAGIDLVHGMVGGDLFNCRMHAGSLAFLPGDGNFNTKAEKESDKSVSLFEADPKTAGSVCLLSQIALPVALFAPHEVQLRLKGGTNTGMAPLFDYASEVLQPFLNQYMGTQIEFQLERRGYYPRGGGRIRVNVCPLEGPLPPVVLTSRGEISSIRILAMVSGRVPSHVADTMVRETKKMLYSHYPKIDPEVDRRVADGPGQDDTAFLLVVATTDEGLIFGASGIGERGKQAKFVARDAVESLLEDLDHLGSCIGRHLLDQIIIFMALAKGESVVRTGPLTMHTKTAIHWATTLTDAEFKVDLVDDVEDVYEVRCTGIGYTSRFK